MSFEVTEKLSFLSPEKNLLNVLSLDYPEVKFTEENAEVIYKNFGRKIKPDSERPFYNDINFKESLNVYDLNKKKPNIVFYLAESFSQSFLNYFPDNVKNIKRFAAMDKSISFNNFYSMTHPTVHGLMATLCSYIPVHSYLDFIDPKNMKKVDLLCLPEILAAQGYNDYYLTGEDVNFARKKIFLTENGYSEFRDFHYYKKENKYEELGSWGFSDLQLSDFFVQELEANEYKEPFFVTIKTSDLHSPFKNAKGTTRVSENSLINLVHTTDQAFAKVLEALERKSMLDNTILVFVADHSAPLAPEDMNRYLKGEKDNSRYDRIPFIIYGPGNKLGNINNTISSQVDFTPTILHLLNIKTSNSFDGLSILEDRKSFPNFLGGHPENLFYFLDDERNNLIKSQSKEEAKSCLEEPSNLDSKFDFCDYLTWMNYKYHAIENYKFWSDDWLK